MNKEHYISEVEKRLSRIFSASKDGYKISTVERNRLEGFMQAGVFIGLVTNKELSRLMEDVHISIFDKTIRERKNEQDSHWRDEEIDYSQYEQPTFGRK